MTTQQLASLEHDHLDEPEILAEIEVLEYLVAPENGFHMAPYIYRRLSDLYDLLSTLSKEA